MISNLQTGVRQKSVLIGTLRLRSGYECSSLSGAETNGKEICRTPFANC